MRIREGKVQQYLAVLDLDGCALHNAIVTLTNLSISAAFYISF